jgi:hypothetical protein
VGRRDRKKAQHKSQHDEISNAASSAKNLHNRTLQPEILDTFPTPNTHVYSFAISKFKKITD